MTMQRRAFLKVMGSSTVLALAQPLITAAMAEETKPGFDTDPIGGYVKRPPKAYLFTDHRLIRPSDLYWANPDGKGLPLTNPPYPVVDAHAVANNVPHGIRLVAQPARTEPVEGDPPPPPGLVVEANGSYYAFNFGIDYPPGQDLGAYSTADPNAVWVSASRSPDLQTWADLAKCNIDIPGQTRMDGFTAFHDPHGSPDERFKAVYMAHPPKARIPALWEAYQKLHPRHRDVRIDAERLTCIYGLTSPDGIKWTPIKEPLFTHYSDTDTTVCYDDWLGKYVMYTRLYLTERRMVAICEGEDFRHWGPVSALVWPGLDESLSTDVYTNARTSYPGMPEVHLMFPMFYHRFDQTSDIRLFTSIDGLHWNQVPGGPILARSSFQDSGIEFLVASKPLLPLPNDRVGFRYSASLYPHKYPRWKQGLKPGKSGWAWWEKGRLVAVTADEEGEFVTFSIPVMGRGLRINARTPRAGMVKVGFGGRPIEDCDPIVGDSLTHAVRWKGNADVGLEPGKTVSIKFHLRRAELFGFEWVT
jgi:hypothetical protein